MLIIAANNLFPWSVVLRGGIIITGVYFSQKIEIFHGGSKIFSKHQGKNFDKIRNNFRISQNVSTFSFTEMFSQDAPGAGEKQRHVDERPGIQQTTLSSAGQVTMSIFWRLFSNVGKISDVLKK